MSVGHESIDASNYRALRVERQGDVLIITFHVPGRGRKLEGRAHTEPKLEGDAAAVGRCELVVR